MTKSDLIHNISQNTGVDLVSTRVVIEEFMDETIDALANGKSIYLRGFGTFASKKRAKRLARDINKGTTVLVPERVTPVFIASKNFKERVN